MIAGIGKIPRVLEGGNHGLLVVPMGFILLGGDEDGLLDVTAGGILEVTTDEVLEVTEDGVFEAADAEVLKGSDHEPLVG